MKRLIILLAVLLLAGCCYKSTITYSEDGNSATLKSNTKANVRINLEKKEAEIEQLGEPFWKKLFPKNVEISPK